MPRFISRAFIACLISAAVSSVLSADAADVTFTFGYIRTLSPTVDSPDRLAGFLATIKHVNDNNIVPGVKFALDVTTIDCDTVTACRAYNDITHDYVKDFVAKMDSFSAILLPNIFVSPAIVAEAKVRGGIPVLDPADITAESFSSTNTHAIFFRPNWQRQTDHLFTFMQQTYRCAHTGIIHGPTTGMEEEYEAHIAHVIELYANGDYPTPEVLEVATATDAQLRTFFAQTASNLRTCYIVLGSHALHSELVTRLQAMPSVDLSAIRFYGVSHVMTSTFVTTTGDSSPFGNTFFTHWLPAFVPTMLTTAYTTWYNGGTLPATDSGYFFSGTEVIAHDTVFLSTVEAYFIIRYAMEVIRSAVSYAPTLATTGDRPIPIADIVTAFYREGRTIDGHKFNAPMLTAPEPPTEESGFCNIVSATSYMYRIDPATGSPAMVYDDRLEGQRRIAAVDYANKCGYTATSWSYPLTGLAVYPQGFFDGTRVDAAFDIYHNAFKVLSREANYAPTAPTRPQHYYYDSLPDNTVDIAPGIINYVHTKNPFVFYGSMSGEGYNTGRALTLSKSLVGLELEDPPLVPHSQWKWNTVNVRPTIADFIHSIAGYYSTRSGEFTSFHALATTKRVAELISMSFATWGYDVPVSSILISTEPADWERIVGGWFRNPNSAKPYVIVGSDDFRVRTIESAAAVAGPIGKGMLAIACTVVVSYRAHLVTEMKGDIEIIFGAFRREWWMDADHVNMPAELLQYKLNPTYHLASLLVDFARQLYSQVYFNYKTTAAEALYKMMVVTAADASYGPFYNTTCSDEDIRTNNRDRKCQCTKGTRTVFVHSMADLKARQLSYGTGQYSWTMTTCGVVYEPYIPPPTIPDNSLKAGAIAGIAVGASVAFLFVLGFMLYLACFTGRNNGDAPKDASKPFAIVFTDIQSSTALWARAPACMSAAIDCHHALLRKIIRKNDGYEVKTVGDSFMVAFKDVNDAVKFAMDTQLILYDADWSDEIDATYVELLLEAAQEAEGADVAGTPSQSADFTQHNIVSKHMDSLASSHSSQQHVSGDAQQQQHISGDQQPNLLAIQGVSRTFEDAFKSNNESLVDHKSTVKVPPSKSASMCHPSINRRNPMTGGELDTTAWHGIRVRIGVHFGMGDIRKDPVSQGYDYYGTVVNTAARVEGVGHGGQTLLTHEAMEGLNEGFIRTNKIVMIALGAQPLRGLDAPLRLYQLVPERLQSRQFPALRLHIEKQTEDDSLTASTTEATTVSESPEMLIERLCNGKQFQNVHPDEVLDRFNFMESAFAPTTEKYRHAVISKLAESWGFEKSKMQQGGNGAHLRLMVMLIGKITRAYATTHKRGGANAKRPGSVSIGSSKGGPTTYGRSTTTTNNAINQANLLKKSYNHSEIKSIVSETA